MPVRRGSRAVSGPGICPGSVVYPPFARPLMWAATRRCLWKISAVVEASRTSTSQRASTWGMLQKRPST